MISTRTLTFQDLAFSLNCSLISWRMQLILDILAQMSHALSRFQFAILAKNSWSIVANIGLASWLKHIILNSIILLVSSGT